MYFDKIFEILFFRNNVVRLISSEERFTQLDGLLTQLKKAGS